MPIPPTDPSLSEAAAACLPPEEAHRIAGMVRDHELFRELPEAALTELVARGIRVVFHPGEFLMRRGEASDYALLIIDGTCDITIDTAYDHAHLATATGPGVVGEIGAFTGVPRTASVRARTQVSAVRLAAGDLAAAGQAHPAFLFGVMRQIGGRYATFNRAFGFYSNALNALERQDFDMRLLDELQNPLPELVDFSQSFRRLAQEIMGRQAHRREMANAAAIQRAMLPPSLPSQALGFRAEVHAEMRPATEVGGDFFDFFPLPRDRMVVTIGDVSGKGIPASLFMGAAQTAIRYVLRNEDELGEGVRIANDLLCATNSEVMFVTLFCGVLDLKTGQLDYCNCGHTDCMILRADGRLERPTPTGIALGLMEERAFPAVRTQLDPGDRLFLFTDGLTDATNADGEAYGEERLEEAALRLRPLDNQPFITRLLDEIEAFCLGASPFDDVTAVGMTFLGEAGLKRA